MNNNIKSNRDIDKYILNCRNKEINKLNNKYVKIRNNIQKELFMYNSIMSVLIYNKEKTNKLLKSCNKEQVLISYTLSENEKSNILYLSGFIVDLNFKGITDTFIRNLNNFLNKNRNMFFAEIYSKLYILKFKREIDNNLSTKSYTVTISRVDNFFKF
jgi:hypothetical protein